MSNEIVPAAGGGSLPASVSAIVDLFAAILSGRTAETVRAYSADYEDFARFLGSGSPSAALNTLISLPHGIANASALAYRAHLSDRKLAPSTIARRLAALRSAVKLARQLGRVSWELEVESPRTDAYRDTRGPGREGWRSMLGTARATASEGTPKGRRDLAMIRLMHDLALRRKEVLGLDLADVDLAGGTIQITGKGKREKVPVTIPDPVRHALADWISIRGAEPGPLFTRLDGASKGERLTGRGAYKIVRGLGTKAGLSRPVRPHGLRHQGITQALDATGGDVRAVRRFSRHSKLDTLMIYDDNRKDLAGDVARLISED